MDDLSRPSFLAYRGEEPPFPEPPSRVYARIDHVAPTESGGPPELSPFDGHDVALLDSVDADWFDAIERGKLADPETVDEADENVSVLAIPTTELFPRLENFPEVHDHWIEIELEDGGGPRVLQYMNLFAPPIERGLLSAAWVESPLDRELADKTSMDDLDDATQDQLIAVLAGLESPGAAAVYDVGQGNCDAVLRSGTPRVYFDLGGGVLAHRNTFPPPLTTFCFKERPPIVLSHWDWDHWSSANRDPRAYSQTWIVPRQGTSGLGAVHRTFLARVLQRGNALVWPDALPSVQHREYALVKCTGPPSVRNNSGLALVIERTRDGDSQRMLFPGDCAYNFIPSVKTSEFTSLVAPHHGGRTGPRGDSFVPSSDRRPSGRVVYSYGEPNSYGHPQSAVCSDHINEGWLHARETSSRCPPRFTRAASHVLGHVHLYWDPDTPDENPTCGGDVCQLTCHQR